MDAKEEILEEINDVEEINEEITPDRKIEEVVIPKEENQVRVENVQTPILNDTTPNEAVIQPNVENNAPSADKENEEHVILNQEYENQPEVKEQQITKEESTKKSKIPLIIIFSILLVIDVVFLIIYIIGIDKVLGFVK